MYIVPKINYNSDCINFLQGRMKPLGKYLLKQKLKFEAYLFYEEFYIFLLKWIKHLHEWFEFP